MENTGGGNRLPGIYPMKIGLVRRGYSATGGAENYLCRLADALEAAGHEPVLLTTPDWPRDRWPTKRLLIHVTDYGYPHLFARGVEAVRERHRFDFVFSLERVRRCDCYRAGDGVHRAWLDRRARVEPWWKRVLRPFNRKHTQILALEKRLFARGGARRIIANSELVRREIVDYYGTPADRISLVYNGLPAEYFEPVPDEVRTRTRAELELKPDDYAILFAGTGWERKGLAHVLRAVERLPAALRPVLLVAGRGNPRPFLRVLTAAVRERVRFLGPVKEMRAVYAAADVFAAPTLYDPFANACLEALASGLPVLTTSANGVAEIIERGVHGDVCEVEDGASGKELARLLADWAEPARRVAARPLCAGRAGEFTIERNVAETLDVLLR